MQNFFPEIEKVLLTIVYMVWDLSPGPFSRPPKIEVLEKKMQNYWFPYAFLVLPIISGPIADLFFPIISGPIESQKTRTRRDLFFPIISGPIESQKTGPVAIFFSQ
jgi:hypothetical protein